MKSKIVRTLSTLFAAAIICMSPINTNAEEIGTADIYLADENWSEQQYWGGDISAEGNMGIKLVQSAVITGNGTYTAHIEFEKPMSYGSFFALVTNIPGTSDNKFADYPEADMKIKSITINGEEALSGRTDAPAVCDNELMRINIYNPWADKALNFASDPDWSEGLTDITVEFEVTGIPMPSEETEASEAQTEAIVQTGTDKPEKVPYTGNVPVSVYAAAACIAITFAAAFKRR